MAGFKRRLESEGHILVNLASSNSKAFFAERFIRTFRQLLAVKRTALDLDESESEDWEPLVERILSIYNATPHSSLSFLTPADVLNFKKNVTAQVTRHSGQTKGEFMARYRESRDKLSFSVGDFVRITKTRGHAFQKSSENTKISLEIFKVAKIRPPILDDSKKNLYQLRDLNDKLILGLFRENELVRIASTSRHHPLHPDFKLSIRNVVSQRRLKGQEHYRVTFNGEFKEIIHLPKTEPTSPKHRLRMTKRVGPCSGGFIF